MSQVKIREARSGDLEFVQALMENALAPYYNGDHSAHARRIFNTHIAGGKDKVGHFSTEQRMFILTDDEKPVGMINVVGKRQDTWKISPLIVAPSAQGSRGFGTMLLEYVESYARERGARQMYCTVAMPNTSAFRFFRRKGYAVAGSSESHYKPGVTEVMLYKQFIDPAQEDVLDRIHVSVIPFDASTHAVQARKLILSQLPQNFRGVDDAWVDALYRGHERRLNGEVNEKYKLIFVAVDREGVVHGVVGATPKKGEPIKLMPCVAANAQAYAALLIDLPHLLRTFGRKLYTHCIPSVAETVALQRLGWTLDAVMPGAYHDDFCTQQWGNNLEEGLMRKMRMKQVYFEHIMTGRKTLEVRVGYPSIRQIEPNERIQLMTASHEAVIVVRAVRNYATFEAMLDAEPCEKIVPDTNRADALRVLRGIYPADKEQLGVFVFEIAVER